MEEIILKGTMKLSTTFMDGRKRTFTVTVEGTKEALALMNMGIFPEFVNEHLMLKPFIEEK